MQMAAPPSFLRGPTPPDFLPGDSALLRALFAPSPPPAPPPPFCPTRDTDVKGVETECLNRNQAKSGLDDESSSAEDACDPPPPPPFFAAPLPAAARLAPCSPAPSSPASAALAPPTPPSLSPYAPPETLPRPATAAALGGGSPSPLHEPTTPRLVATPPPAHSAPPPPIPSEVAAPVPATPAGMCSPQSCPHCGHQLRTPSAGNGKPPPSASAASTVTVTTAAPPGVTVQPASVSAYRAVMPMPALVPAQATPPAEGAHAPPANPLSFMVRRPPPLIRWLSGVAPPGFVHTDHRTGLKFPCPRLSLSLNASRSPLDNWLGSFVLVALRIRARRQPTRPYTAARQRQCPRRRCPHNARRPLAACRPAEWPHPVSLRHARLHSHSPSNFSTSSPSRPH